MEEERVRDGERKERRRSRHGFWSGTVLGGVLGILVAGGLFFTTDAVKAAGQFLGAHGHHRFGTPPSPEVVREHTDFAIDWVLSRVDAGEDQRERAKTIIASTIDDLFPLMEQHRDNRKAFVTELAKPTIDREALEQLRRAELEIADQASARLVTTLADVAEVLTPQQRTELIELAERFHRR